MLTVINIQSNLVMKTHKINHFYGHIPGLSCTGAGNNRFVFIPVEAGFC